MPKKVAVIDYTICDPGHCQLGVCQAQQACPRHLLKQEEAFEQPDAYTNMCLGCGVCLRACPQKAVRLV